VDEPSTTDVVMALVGGPVLVVVGSVLVRYRHELSREFRSAKRLRYPGRKGERLARTQSPLMAVVVGGAFVLMGCALFVLVGVLRIPM